MSSSLTAIQSTGFALFSDPTKFPIENISNNNGVAAFTTAYINSLTKDQKGKVTDGSIFSNMGPGIFVTNSDSTDPNTITYWIQGSKTGTDPVDGKDIYNQTYVKDLVNKTIKIYANDAVNSIYQPLNDASFTYDFTNNSIYATLSNVALNNVKNTHNAPTTSKYSSTCWEFTHNIDVHLNDVNSYDIVTAFTNTHIDPALKNSIITSKILITLNFITDSSTIQDITLSQTLDLTGYNVSFNKPVSIVNTNTTSQYSLIMDQYLNTAAPMGTSLDINSSPFLKIGTFINFCVLSSFTNHLLIDIAAASDATIPNSYGQLTLGSATSPSYNYTNTGIMYVKGFLAA